MNGECQQGVNTMVIPARVGASQQPPVALRDIATGQSLRQIFRQRRRQLGGLVHGPGRYFLPERLVVRRASERERVRGGLL
jgi:hypothetical protein